MSILSILKPKYKYDPFTAEIEAEITMLQHVLSSAGVPILNHEHLNNSEFRTYLISQMKYVIGVIDELQKISAIQLKEDTEYSKIYDDELKALREENKLLKDAKEKIYILRER
jgi:hypothetical protein